MLDQGNRTFIGSVVFVDIVGYSKKSVSEQISVKDRFTALLSESLTDIPPEQRLILDTGDGAALSFLGDPEDALFVSMNLRDMVDRAIAEAGGPSVDNVDTEDSANSEAPGGLPLRIGINLGPVKLVRDINGHPNIVGDGINVAQRIMSFARPGQIVVSRSFFDVVSVISDEYAKLFKYEGSRTDKHVREHEIYIVGDSDAAFKKAKAGTVDRAAATNPNTRAQRQAGVGTGTYGVRQLGDVEQLPFLQDKRKLTMAGGALAALVLVLAMVLILKKPADKTPPVDPAVVAAANSPAGTQPTKTDAPGTAATPVDNSKPADATTPANPSATPGPASSTAPVPATGAPANGTATATPPADGKSTPAAGKTEPAKDTAKAEAAKAALLEGRLNLSIQPWGDVFVNGKSIGVSPPLKQFKLAPGKYRIEVKNTSFTPYSRSIEIKPKEDVSITHKFQ
ncbi:MAG: PEGA domain-containing protein [Betaproteobacteria bacterium]